MLTTKMKKEVINYIMHYTKGLIEDVDSISTAYDNGEVTSEELEDFIDEMKDYALTALG